MKPLPLLALTFHLTVFLTNAIVEDYKLNVTNTGPAVYGSNITFHAVLYLGTSQTPADPKQFTYEWRSTIGDLKATQHAYFNTSLQRCYESMIQPKKYKMSVIVYSEDSMFIPVASNAVDFFITDTLNGNLKFNQSVYRSPHAGSNTFSTKVPVNFTANLTDIFQYSPEFTYKWYIDGTQFEGGNTPNSTFIFTESGRHTVEVAVFSSGHTLDCKNSSYLRQMNGSFKAELILKDPVSNMTLYGKRSLKHGQEVALTAVFNGSSPYTFCWNLSSSENPNVVLNRSCTQVNEAPVSFISIPGTDLPHTGKYFLNIIVENDISVFKKHLFLNITAVPTPISEPSTHSAATILGPVLGALVAVTVIFFGTLFLINYRRNRLHHIESADFTFHGSIRRTSKPGWFWSNVKEAFWGLLNNSRRESDISSSPLLETRQYGSMVNPATTI